MAGSKQLYRSRDKRMVAGVCAGLGDFFGIDPTVVRLLFVFGVIFGYGVLALIYFVLFIVVPEEPETRIANPPTAEPVVVIEPPVDAVDPAAKSPEQDLTI